MRKLPEVGLRRELRAIDRRRRKVRQLRLAEHEGEIATARDLDTVGERARQVREQGSHLGLRLEVLLRVETLHAARVGERLALGDADARLVRLEVVRRQKLYRMRRDDRQAEFGRERHGGAHVRLVRRAAGALQLNIEAPREQRRQTTAQCVSHR